MSSGDLRRRSTLGRATRERRKEAVLLQKTADALLLQKTRVGPLGRGRPPRCCFRPGTAYDFKRLASGPLRPLTRRPSALRLVWLLIIWDFGHGRSLTMVRAPAAEHAWTRDKGTAQRGRAASKDRRCASAGEPGCFYFKRLASGPLRPLTPAQAPSASLCCSLFGTSDRGLLRWCGSGGGARLDARQGNGAKGPCCFKRPPMRLGRGTGLLILQKTCVGSLTSLDARPSALRLVWLLIIWDFRSGSPPLVRLRRRSTLGRATRERRKGAVLLQKTADAPRPGNRAASTSKDSRRAPYVP